MMEDSNRQYYVQLVLVEFVPAGKRYLFEAPPWTDSIKPGAVVVVEDNKVVRVVDSITVDACANRRLLRFMMAETGARWPLARITGVIESPDRMSRWCTWPRWEQDSGEAVGE